MTAAAPDVEPLKHIQRFIWSQGNYSALARENFPAAETLVEAIGITPGDELLDVAAGDGNVAVAAARRGARVVASDLTPAMLDLGRARTDAEGLEVEWVEADAEALPFPDDRFDHVTSAFGAMFAPRPDVVAAELLRVTRPGGTVALASWTPSSYVGQLSATMAPFLPPPPVPVPRPFEWGLEATARERLAPLTAAVTVARHVARMRGASIETYVADAERNNGPLVAAQMLLGARYAELRAALRGVIEACNQARDGSVEIESEFLLVVARKPA